MIFKFLFFLLHDLLRLVLPLLGILWFSSIVTMSMFSDGCLILLRGILLIPQRSNEFKLLLFFFYSSLKKKWLTVSSHIKNFPTCSGFRMFLNSSIILSRLALCAKICFFLSMRECTIFLNSILASCRDFFWSIIWRLCSAVVLRIPNISSHSLNWLKWRISYSKLSDSINSLSWYLLYFLSFSTRSSSLSSACSAAYIKYLA